METNTEIKTEVISSVNQETHPINNNNNEILEKIENENIDENDSSSTKKVVLKKNVRKLKVSNQNEQNENIPIENIEIEVSVGTHMNNQKEMISNDNINEKNGDDKKEIIIQNEFKINNELDKNEKNEVKGYLDEDFDDEDNKKIYLRVVKRMEKTYGVPIIPAKIPGEPIEDIEIEENIRPILINNENKNNEQKGINNKKVPDQNNTNKNKENIEINNYLPKNTKYEVEQRRANEKSNYIPNNMSKNNKINYNKTGISQYNSNPINYNKFVNTQIPNKNNYNNYSNHIEYYMSDSQNKYNNNYVNKPNSRYNYNDNKNTNNRPPQYIYNSQNIYNDNNYRPNKNISNSQNIYISNNNYNKRPQNVSKSQNNYIDSGNHYQNKYNNYINRPDQNIFNSQKANNTNYINRTQQHKSNSQKNYNNNIYINRPQQYISNSQNKYVNRPQQNITNSQNMYNSRYDNIPKRSNITPTGYNQKTNGPKINNVDLNLYNNNINLKNEYLYQKEHRNTPNKNTSNIPYNKNVNSKVNPSINNKSRGYSYENPIINLEKRYENKTPKFNYNSRYQDNSNNQFDRRRTPNNNMIPDKNHYINVGRSLQLCDMVNPKRYNNFNMRKTYYITNSKQQNNPGNPKGMQNTGKIQNKNNHNYYVTRSLMNNKSPVIPNRENLQNYQVNYKNNYKDNNNLNNRYLVSSSQTFNNKSVNENATSMNQKRNISLYKNQKNYNAGDLNLNDNNRRNNRNNSQNQFVKSINNVNYLSRKPNNTPINYSQDIQFNFNHYNY